MAGRKFKIRLDSRGLGTIEVDGEQVTGVCGVKVEAEPLSPPKVTLSFWASELDMDAEEVEVEAD